MFGNIGYSLTATGFAVLLLLLLTVRSHAKIKYFLGFALIANLSWAVQHISWFFPSASLQQFLFFDGVKQLSWILFLSAAMHNQIASISGVLRQKSTFLSIIVPVLCLALVAFYPQGTSWIFLGLTVTALTILLQLEVLIRQAGDQRWAFKPLVIFLGMVNVLEFVTYANASMVNFLGAHFIAAKGYVYALFIPFMLIAMRRMDSWGIRIFVSREIVLHSTLLMVAGIYLFAMATVGYIIQYLGGTWSASVQIVLAIVALFLLVVILASAQFRQTVRVFITKNFFANQFDYRERWIALTNTLEVGEKELTDVYTTALQGCLRSIEYEHGVLCKLEQNALTTVAQTNALQLQGMDHHVLNTVATYCQNKPWIVDLSELIVRPEQYPDLNITPQQAKSSQLQFILPIYHENKLWGLAAMFQVNGVFRPLNWELRDYLNAILAQVSNFILHHEASHMVAENAQFAAFSRMSAFVVHDLKNVLAQVDLILCNAQTHKDNPEFIDDTFETLEHTRTRMQKMLKQLTDKHVATHSLAQSCDLSSIINTVAEKLCATLEPHPLVIVDSEHPAACDCDKLQNVLYHLVSNAQQATADDGVVEIHARDADASTLLIQITDNGCGMSEEFIRNRLFKPFDTTKGNAGMGIGAYDAKHYIEEIGGRITVESELGQGTCFSLYIPKAGADTDNITGNKEVSL